MADEAPIDDRAAERRPEPESWDGRAVTDWMSTPHGRRLMERFLDHCGAGQRLYRFDADGLGMAWRDGMADAGRFWESLLMHHCPDLFLRMIKERRSRLEKQQNDVARKEARRDPTAAPPLVRTSIEDQADEQAVRLEQEAEADRKRQADEARKPQQRPRAKPKD
jgi:hypothetical protein